MKYRIFSLSLGSTVMLVLFLISGHALAPFCTQDSMGDAISHSNKGATSNLTRALHNSQLGKELYPEQQLDREFVAECQLSSTAIVAKYGPALPEHYVKQLSQMDDLRSDAATGARPSLTRAERKKALRVARLVRDTMDDYPGLVRLCDLTSLSSSPEAWRQLNADQVRAIVFSKTIFSSQLIKEIGTDKRIAKRLCELLGIKIPLLKSAPETLEKLHNACRFFEWSNAILNFNKFRPLTLNYAWFSTYGQKERIQRLANPSYPDGKLYISKLNDICSQIQELKTLWRMYPKTELLEGLSPESVATVIMETASPLVKDLDNPQEVWVAFITSAFGGQTDSFKTMVNALVGNHEYSYLIDEQTLALLTSNLEQVFAEHFFTPNRTLGDFVKRMGKWKTWTGEILEIVKTDKDREAPAKAEAIPAIREEKPAYVETPGNVDLRYDQRVALEWAINKSSTNSAWRHFDVLLREEVKRLNYKVNLRLKPDEWKSWLQQEYHKSMQKHLDILNSVYASEPPAQVSRNIEYIRAKITQIYLNNDNTYFSSWARALEEFADITLILRESSNVNLVIRLESPDSDLARLRPHLLTAFVALRRVPHAWIKQGISRRFMEGRYITYVFDEEDEAKKDGAAGHYKPGVRDHTIAASHQVDRTINDFNQTVAHELVHAFHFAGGMSVRQFYDILLEYLPYYPVLFQPVVKKIGKLLAEAEQQVDTGYALNFNIKDFESQKALNEYLRSEHEARVEAYLWTQRKRELRSIFFHSAAEKGEPWVTCLAEIVSYALTGDERAISSLSREVIGRIRNIARQQFLRSDTAVRIITDADSETLSYQFYEFEEDGKWHTRYGTEDGTIETDESGAETYAGDRIIANGPQNLPKLAGHGPTGVAVESYRYAFREFQRMVKSSRTKWSDYLQYLKELRFDDEKREQAAALLIETQPEAIIAINRAFNTFLYNRGWQLSWYARYSLVERTLNGKSFEEITGASEDPEAAELRAMLDAFAPKHVTSST